jgi:hypothetical protein
MEVDDARRPLATEPSDSPRICAAVEISSGVMRPFRSSSRLVIVYLSFRGQASPAAGFDPRVSDTDG